MSAETQTRVFVSSTTLDLAPYRKTAFDVCQRLNLTPDGMEEFGPDPRKAVAVCQEKVEAADIYLLILAHRYGWRPGDATGPSITELEYRWAKAAGLEIVVFLVQEDALWPPTLVDKGDAYPLLERFKSELKSAHTVAWFDSEQKLRDELWLHMPRFRREAPSEALRDRSALPAPPEPFFAHYYSLLPADKLVGRREELALLSEWVSNAHSELADVRVLSVVAIGGMGKSALTWRWFNEIAPEVMPHLAGRMWWSFYERDAGYERFVSNALAYFTRRSVQEVEATTNLGLRESELLSILDRKPHLIVLDGLERILVAYARLDAARLPDDDLDEETANRVADALGLPASATESFVGRHHLRRCINPWAGNFLRKLSRVRASRILVSTRLHPAELQLNEGAALPGCKAVFLKGLRDEDSVALWRSLGVSGSEAELREVFSRFENYPLLVRALAGEVARFRRAPGDFDAWRASNPGFDPASVPMVQVKSHVLQYALQDLDARPRKLLETVAGFRAPAQYETLLALSGDETELDADLVELEDRGLVGWDRRTNTYDLHPIARSVVWSGLSEEGRAEVYGTLATHFKAIPRGNSDKPSRKEVERGIELVRSLIGAQRFKEASNIFFARLNLSGMEGFGFVQPRLEILEAFAAIAGTAKWRDLILQGSIFAQLGHGCAQVGQLNRAVEQYDASMAEDRGRSSPAVLKAQARVLKRMGRLRDASRSAQLAVEAEWYADSRKHHLAQVAVLNAVRGRPKKARAKLLALKENTFFSHCNYLAIIEFQGGNQSAALAAEALSESERKSDPRFEQIRLLRGTILVELGRLEEARALLHRALVISRSCTYVDTELVALVALAEIHRQHGELALAREHLDDLWDAAERGPFRLIQADANNVLARIERDDGNPAAALEAATRAYRFAWCDGPPYAYHRGLTTAEALIAELGGQPPDMD